MLTTRTPMKRTGFKRRGQANPQAVGFSELAAEYTLNREQRIAERALRAIKSACPTPAHIKMGPNSTPTAPIKKDHPLRSEPYRRLVAALPCAWCGIVGYSQHAHENAGKGARLKVDDRRAMPLCCARPGIEGCHIPFDQYRLVPGGRDAHNELGRAMADRTRTRIMESGQWPAKLPLWQEGGSDAI